jgi:succinate dehydrogenase / fumarate reductase flavoprotein subunit
MYEKITAANPMHEPMMIFPAVHYTMGGLWVDYNLMSTIPGLFALGESNFSDHGANRLGASALMQGLADGYFVIPYTIGSYLAGIPSDPVDADHLAFKQAADEAGAKIDRLLAIKGKKTVDEIHRELGLWKKSLPSGKNSGRTLQYRAAARNSTSHWNVQAGLPISWNLPN